MTSRDAARILIEEAIRAMAIFGVLYFGGVIHLVRLLGVQLWPALLGALGLALLAFLVLVLVRLKTGRELKVRPTRLALVLAVTLVVSLLALWLTRATAGSALRATVVERLRGETVEAKVDAYAEAIVRDDEATALAAWKPPAEDQDDTRSNALRERRQDVTRDLIAAELDPAYTITHIEWWSTCCEPGPVCDPRNAGGARVRVQFLDAEGKPVTYLFDVFHQDGPYWGAAAGYQPRRWALYDVYPREEEPLYWRFVYKPAVEWLDWPPSTTDVQ